MEKEQYIRTAFITAWLKDISQERVLEVFQMYNAKNICIGSIEKTENELEHFHVIVSFSRSVKFSTLKNICHSFHIERCESKNATEYSCKEGIYYNAFDLTATSSTDIYIILIYMIII